MRSALRLRQIERPLGADLLRDDLGDEIIERGRADGLQHLGRLGSSSGPIWRGMKLAPGSSSARVARLVDMSLYSLCPDLSKRQCHEFVVSGLVHEIVELALVLELHLHEPGAAFGLAVDESRIAFELAC